MKRLLFFLLITLLSAKFVWILYPTSIAAETFTAKRSPEQFVELKRRIVDYYSTRAVGRLTITGDGQDHFPLDLSCNGAPLLTLMRHESTTLLVLYSGAARRFPDVVSAADLLSPEFGDLRSALTRDQLEQMSWLEKLVLRIRDGADFESRCDIGDKR